MNKSLLTTTLGLTSLASIGLTGISLAGTAIPSLTSPSASGAFPSFPSIPSLSGGDWCETLSGIGKVYSNSDNPFIQEVKFSGRFHAQYAYVDGDDVNDDSFSEDFFDIRRLRLGAQIKLFNNFKIMGRANFINDSTRSGGDRDFGFQDWDELKATYSQKNVLGFDKVEASYGRHKVGVGYEARLSSKKIKTVERTGLSNKIFSNRYTGLLLSAEKGNWNGTIGYLSLADSDSIGSISQGSAIYALSEFELSNGDDLSFDLFYNLDADGSGEDEVGVGYEWAATAAYGTKVGNWDLRTQLVLGDNGDTDYQGNPDRTDLFWGVIIEPSTYLIKDKLEFVTRYAYQGSREDEGIRINSRYTRANNGGDVNGGRGDSHHSIYAGLNYYLCNHHAKVLLGAEYEMLDTPTGDVDATTLWAAYRMYF